MTSFGVFKVCLSVCTDVTANIRVNDCLIYSSKYTLFMLFSIHRWRWCPTCHWHLHDTQEGNQHGDWHGKVEAVSGNEDSDHQHVLLWISTDKITSDQKIMFGWSFSHFQMWSFKTFQHTEGDSLKGACVFLTVCLHVCKYTSLQAYADYMGFILSLNKMVKGKKLTLDYTVSEVFN